VLVRREVQDVNKRTRPFASCTSPSPSPHSASQAIRTPMNGNLNGTTTTTRAFWVLEKYSCSRPASSDHPNKRAKIGEGAVRGGDGEAIEWEH
jgi:hypothetical protein